MSQKGPLLRVSGLSDVDSTYPRVNLPKSLPPGQTFDTFWFQAHCVSVNLSAEPHTHPKLNHSTFPPPKGSFKYFIIHFRQFIYPHPPSVMQSSYFHHLQNLFLICVDTCVDTCGPVCVLWTYGNVSDKLMIDILMFWQLIYVYFYTFNICATNCTKLYHCAALCVQNLEFAIHKPRPQISFIKGIASS